jgi:hypothetical protein
MKGRGVAPRTETSPADGPGGKSAASLDCWPSHLAITSPGFSVSHFFNLEPDRTVVLTVRERRLDFLYS